MKKLTLVALPVAIILIGLHLIPVYVKTITACATSPVTKNGRMIFGSTKSGIESQIRALEAFNANIDCATNDVTYKLFVL
jgi:hypothetical protein